MSWSAALASPRIRTAFLLAIPYRLAIRELDVPAYRDILLALRGRRTAGLAVRRFLGYLDRRNERPDKAAARGDTAASGE